MKPHVLLTERLDEAPAAWLAERVHLSRLSPERGAAFREALATADGLVIRTYTRVDEAMLAAAPRLRVVGRAGVGLDNVDLQACQRRGVRVVHTPDANTQAVVEYVWALIFDAIRPRASLERYVQPSVFHEMRDRLRGTQVDQMVLGILGVGRIGRRVARVADAFGMRVLGHDLLSPQRLGLDSGLSIRLVDAPTLWSESDILTIHVDGRAANRHYIDGRVLERLKPSCLLINTSRGSVIDHHALARWANAAASTGGRAVLDVHDPEPPHADYPLFGLPNVRLLPHLASRTTTAMANMSWVVRDVVAVLEGREPKWPAV